MMNDIRPRPPTHPHFRHHPILRAKTVDVLSDYQHPPRSKHVRSQSHDETMIASPWNHMAQTYAWVAEQECVRQEKERRRVDRWMFEQPFLVTGEFVPKRVRKMSGPEFHELEQTVWEEIVYCYEEEAVRWMKHEEEVRQLAIRREKEKEKAIQEQMQRIEARVRQRKAEEKQRLAEERSRAYAELREREKREQAKAEQTIIDAWRAYETRWVALGSSSEPLSFRTIPWPVVSPPCSLENLTPANIVMFLFSPVHSTKQRRKDRVRSALLRWHPDRFRRLLGRVVKEDRLDIEEGVGIVARCLNDLMSRANDCE